MEQRRLSGKSHWYHETQSSLCTAEVLPLVPEAAWVEDRFLLDLPLPPGQPPCWLQAARRVSEALLPEQVEVSRLHTLSCYDRLSTALTVAQVYGVQRLCNHYAARLAPQPGPDSSRESNRRLAQITQYARQLASQPTLIDTSARTQLEEVGLSVADIVTFNQIIAFVGFQARVVALLQALQGAAPRWLPGMEMQPEAPVACFTQPDAQWQPELAQTEPRFCTPAQQQACRACQPWPLLRPLSGLLMQQPAALNGLVTLFAALQRSECEDGQLVALLTARINGSGSCFNAVRQRWRGASGLPEIVRNGECALHAWSQDYPREQAIIQAVTRLTRAPARFAPDQLAALSAQGYGATDALQLLAWSALCSWLNQLKIGLGHCA